MSYKVKTPAVWASAVALSLSLGLTAPARADLISNWNLIAIDQIKTAGGAVAGTNRAPRVLAIYHLAIHDALASIEKTHAPYSAELAPPEGVVKEAAILGAAHWTLSVFLPGRRSQLNALLDDALDALPASDAIDASYDYGKEVAANLIDARAADGSLATTGYVHGTELGDWQPVDPTLPAEAAVEPYWADVTPFALTSQAQFRPDAPPALDSATYIAAVEQVRTLGAAANTTLTTHTRTATQTEIANFWVQATHVPFFAIARQVVNARDLTLGEEARFFAHLAVAIADARIAAWDAKYEYGHWRPVAAIGTDDGVDGTTLDAEWAPLIAPTPRHPDYPSGHSTTGAAAAAVLAAWFGEDVGFTVASDSLAGVTRAFASFRQAAEENGVSRIYGGIHFSYSNTAGQTLGRSVGNYAVDTLFAELTPPPEPEPDAGLVDDDAGVDEEPDAAVVADASTGTPDASEPEPAVDASTPIDAGGDGDGDGDGEPDAAYVADASDEPTGGKKKDDGCSVSGARASDGLGLQAFALLAGAALLLRRRRAR